jgi:mono/diheme cytochrome c family protein
MSSDEALPGGAAQTFAANCASCHGIGAEGSPDSYFPTLFHNSTLATGDGRNLVATILFGIDRSSADHLAFMPGFGGKATDIASFTNEQVVELANYLLQHYGNAAYSVTPQVVEQVRNGQAPKPLLATLVDLGEWLAGALLIVLVLWRIVRRSSRARV